MFPPHLWYMFLLSPVINIARRVKTLLSWRSHGPLTACFKQVKTDDYTEHPTWDDCQELLATFVYCQVERNWLWEKQQDTGS